MTAPVLVSSTLISVIEDQDARLQCFAYGDPCPEIVWFNNGNRVGSSEEIMITSTVSEKPSHTVSVLSIKRAVKSHGGQYVIRASNDHGECDKTITLKSQCHFSIS